jgi:hypothetical protein
MKKHFLALLILSLAMIFIANDVWAQAATLEVSFQFEEINRGPKGPSPVITVKNIPPTAVRLNVKLRDLDSLSFKHGGGQIDIEPGQSEVTVPQGALKRSYKGPYPPRGKTHTYQFTVEALDSDKKVVGEGIGEGTFLGK